MRIMFLADLQLEAGLDLGYGDFGEGSRFHDQVQVLERIALLVATEKVDLVCVVGDVFERSAPKPWAILAFQDFVRTCVDRGADVLVIAGNHDVKAAALPSALAIFREVEDSSVQVGLAPSLYPYEEVVVATLPWTPISNLVAQQPAGDRDQLHELAAQALVQSAHLLGARCRDEYPDKLPILVGHWSVSGASLPTGLATDLLREPVIPREGLASAGFALVANGHIHKAQVIHEGPPIFYCGSPMVTNWGETSEKHGVWIFETSGSLHFVEIADRPFLTFEDEKGFGPPSIETLVTDYDLRNAVVRYRFTATEEEMRRIDQGEIRQALLDAGAHKVVIQPTVERAQRARVESMDESLGPKESFELWLASQDGDLVDPDALRGLHSEYVGRLS